MSLIGWSLNHLYSTPPEVPLILLITCSSTSGVLSQP